jgi:hypothetical protein
MALSLIDVWDAKTFDEELAAFLAKEAELVRNYLTTDHSIFLSHDLGRDSRGSILRPENPYSSAFNALKNAITAQMRYRTIRAWHYTRLTDPELTTLWCEGIHLSTPTTLRARLDALVKSGGLSMQLADAVYAGSPFHSDQKEIRSNKFWMVSHPLVIDDGDVRPLMAHWGGEVASGWMKDPTLLKQLATTGKPCVLQLSVPLALTRQSYFAGAAVIATFGRSLGCIPSKHSFVLYVTASLPPDAVLKIVSEGDATFHRIGRGYPEGYIDVDIGRWEELTGEDD